ncbi:MAG: N-acetylmuramoyl-L-alanine amidase [Hyphomicrobiales bacterium]
MSSTRLPHAERAAANREARRGGDHVDLLILHYTGMVSAQAAVDWLCTAESGVSCHYLVDEHGGIVQMVDERERAWHAGVSYWKGESDINSRSIGIEIHNPGHTLGYARFPRPQVEAVIALCRDITERHRIRPESVLAHSDVAPGRKIDPGEQFPWRTLARHGVGRWIAPTPIRSQARPITVTEAEIRTMLTAYGYGIDVRGAGQPSLTAVLDAFQRHFRQARVDGVADASTVSTLRRLLASVSGEA